MPNDFILCAQDGVVTETTFGLLQVRRGDGRSVAVSRSNGGPYLGGATKLSIHGGSR
jgi:hypothetical protein